MVKKERTEMDKQKDKLKRMLIAEREKVAGYEQVAKVNSAYISILLKRLGATTDNKIEIKASEITEALARYGTFAVATEEGFALYYTDDLEGNDTSPEEE